MLNRNLKWIFFCLSILIISSTSIGCVSAEFKGESDWENNKRKLCYKFDASVTDQWKTWINEAIENWNNVKDATGWEFVLCGAGETADFDFKLENIPASRRCGGAKTGGDFGKETIKKLTITIDSDITDETWPDGRKPEGGQNGWGKTGDKTLDPVLVIKHELSHVIRLDHSGGSDTGDLEDPITPGNHCKPKDRKPSENDKSEAKKAADNKTVNKKNKGIDAAGGNLSHGGTTITIQPGTLENNYTFGIRPLTKTSTPNPTRLNSTFPHDDRGIVYAVDITSDYPGDFSEPIMVAMKYSNSDIAGGYILGMRHSAIFPAVNESSLQAYEYKNDTQMWIPLSSTLDPETNTVTFNTTALSWFGIGGKASARGHDVAAVDIWPTLTWLDTVDWEATWADELVVFLTATNLGTYTETCNVTLYADLNTMVIGDERVINWRYPDFGAWLEDSPYATITLAPDSGSGWWLFHAVDLVGWEEGNYTLTMVVSVVPEETTTANNVFTAPNLLSVTAITSWLSGDANMDGIVTIVDIVLGAIAFGSTPSDWLSGNWDPRADINQDGLVNIVDLVIMGVNFGQTF